MSKIKAWLIDMQEHAEEIRLARILGIPYDDLIQLDYKIEPVEENGILLNYQFKLTGNPPKQIIRKISRLESGRKVILEPWELDSDYEMQFDAIVTDKDHLERFNKEIENLNALLSLNIEDPNLKRILNRQVFIGIIGTLETFLSDLFINLVFDNDIYFKNFIKTHPEFKKRKFQLREIFDESDKLNETAKKTMLDVIYHNLPTVKEMYEDTFQINFPSIKEVYKYVFQRHDLVHRNGRTKEGKVVETNERAISDLTIKVKQLVKGLVEELDL
jgi:hypothetical protein